ncbi:MAG: double-strand break repair helicase AddA, partial [Paracoccaceae bacterium]
ASKRQVRAANPGASTWLSANAGSGKTRVLTDRVARLLLHDVDPQRILCLTYTKSAASEMQNRLFKTLGAWAMKPDAQLHLALADLGEDGLTPEHLARARRLFARAIETPGGLRIQTIHSFCATLLRRFPLEAGVSPQFTELDDRAARLLREQIVEEMADRLAPDVMAEVALAYTGDDFTSLMEQVAGRRANFTDGPDAALGIPDGESASLIVGSVIIGGEAAWMATVHTVLAGGSSTDSRAFHTLSGLDLTSPTLQTLATLEGVLLTGASAKAPYSAKIGSFPTKDSRALLSSVLPHLDALMLRVEAARARRLLFQAAIKTLTLQRFARAFLPIYASRKAARGWLDFDDLITRAKALLSDPAVAAWVLFRLDGGIDHVLVDEAQDTSPDQWRVIELLTAEFTAGEGTRAGGRTLFVVGDKKQSIYSFQGADVAAFDDKHQAFRGRFEAAKQTFQTLKLEYSFRSAPAILTLVDAALGTAFPHALGTDVAHLAFREMLPGRVDLWPAIASEAEPQDETFEDPVDLVTAAHHSAQLAAKIALEIKRMLDDGVQIVSAEGLRPVHAGDFLILVQRRSTLFSEIIRACKKLLLPIAGADRLRLGAELAVKDLAALLSFLATPEDDLSLAAVLRSPLCGWTEAELYDLAQPRKGYLWEALRSAASQQRTLEFLTDLRDQADFLRPYDLIERTLTRHDGRRRLIARLGKEAEDGIDELLNQALTYERGQVPSLTGFLVWLETDDIQVKRQADAAGGRIRVMTVHGAKGLESEIVILPDTADRKPQDRDEIYLTVKGEPVWKVPKDESPPLIVALRQQKVDREAQENLRLLYVALTRARTWLIVVGAGTVVKEACWYNIVAAGMLAVHAVELDGIQRYETGEWPLAVGLTDRPAVLVIDLAPWMLTHAPSPTKPPEPVSPSNLGGAKIMPGEFDGGDEASAKARGVALHLLLEQLPAHMPEQWADVAAHLLPEEQLLDPLLAEAGAVLSAPHLASLFGSNSLAEVPVTGAFGDLRLYGVIDRLIIMPDAVLAVDYKSNYRIPTSANDTPEGLLRQMGAYQHILGQIYPDRKIAVAILWTRSAELMPLDADIVRAALLRAARDSGGAP